MTQSLVVLDLEGVWLSYWSLIIRSSLVLLKNRIPHPLFLGVSGTLMDEHEVVKKPGTLRAAPLQPQVERRMDLVHLSGKVKMLMLEGHHKKKITHDASINRTFCCNVSNVPLWKKGKWSRTNKQIKNRRVTAHICIFLQEMRISERQSAPWEVDGGERGQLHPWKDQHAGGARSGIHSSFGHPNQKTDCNLSKLVGISCRMVSKTICHVWYPETSPNESTSSN